MDGALLVYTTLVNAGRGLRSARIWTARVPRLCAVPPGKRWVSAWNGEAERGEVAVGILKTRLGLRVAVQAALREWHPY